MRGPYRESRLRDERGVFLSTLPAGRGERQLALTVVLVSVVLFLAAAPFAKEPLAQVWAFIPMYESALVINDLITAVLLFGQFSILRSRALLVLASGYLFTAFMTVSHALTFPGLFSPTGLLGAGPQSTAWLYMFWHGGFPLLVIVYVLLTDEGRETSRPRGHASIAVLSSIASVLVLACGFTLLATAGQDFLPAIMRGNHYTPAMSIVVSSVWGLSLLALVMLWRRRPHSVLDLWLMVVMCAWLFDIALAAVLNAGRFDLGFYAGRIYGLLAASAVLLVLLLENGMLYARLVEVYRELDRQNRSLEQIVAERTQRLLQSEKVATMGSLLAGVAHELNNPLAVLMGQAHLLRELAKDPSLVQRAEKIHAAAERCARIVRNFLSLARQRPPERGDVRLNQVVREAAELLAYELRTSSVEVTWDLAEDLPTLWADSHQLHQVVVNLVGNAHQAMRHLAAPRRIFLTTRPDPTRNRVRLEVTDTGPGIPAAIRSKIFEPFFTTKPPGEGTGLGLSLCRGIIEEHGGTIAVESEPGRGTTFVVELPMLARPAPARGPADVEALPPITPKAILVAEDEPDIAATLAEALQRDGHQVDIAAHGLMALDMLARRSYDLVLSDTKMPNLDGEGLYRQLERRFPALLQRLIFVTGDVLDREKREFLESTGAPCLAKPFDLSEVRRVVHRVLAGASTARAPQP
jgi:signal transduction histidine kinase/CheY-like chemotaxis protein